MDYGPKDVRRVDNPKRKKIRKSWCEGVAQWHLATSVLPSVAIRGSIPDLFR